MYDDTEYTYTSVEIGKNYVVVVVVVVEYYGSCSGFGTNKLYTEYNPDSCWSRWELCFVFVVVTKPLYDVRGSGSGFGTNKLYDNTEPHKKIAAPAFGRNFRLDAYNILDSFDSIF